MKIEEIVLVEQSFISRWFSKILPVRNHSKVMSSWITSLTLVKNNSGDVTMALGNGYRYSIKGVGRPIFKKWVRSSSKGKFWHKHIKNKYHVERLI